MVFKRAFEWVRGFVRSLHGSDTGAELTEDGLLDDNHLNNSDEPVAPEKQVPAVAEVVQREFDLTKQQESFDQLVGQLQGINMHLSQQLGQHAELLTHLNELPGWLEKFPEAMQNQKQGIDMLVEQSKSLAFKSEQFTDVVERIPNEVAKQSDSLDEVKHALAAGAEADVAMRESFNRFNDSLNKLNQTADTQRQGIAQMTRTFAASDRYMKYLVSRQSRRFMWVFLIAMGVSLLAVIGLVLTITIIIK